MSNTSAAIPAEALLAYVSNRTRQLGKLGSGFLAKAMLDPTGPHTLQHARCLEELAYQVNALAELAGLADSVGMGAEGAFIRSEVDSTWQSLIDASHDARMASIGLVPQRRPAPVRPS
jgi:hypothetical protein